VGEEFQRPFWLVHAGERRGMFIHFNCMRRLIAHLEES
jgi:hypothetical protein